MATYNVRKVALSIDIAHREHYRKDVYNGDNKRIAMSFVPSGATLVETINDRDYWTRYYETDTHEVTVNKLP